MTNLSAQVVWNIWHAFGQFLNWYRSPHHTKDTWYLWSFLYDGTTAYSEYWGQAVNQVTKLYRKIGLLDKEEDFCMFKSRYRRKNEQIETLCYAKTVFYQWKWCKLHKNGTIRNRLDSKMHSLKVSLRTKFALGDHPYTLLYEMPSNPKAPSMSFYPDFILILSWFYPDFIQVLSR